MLTEGSLKPRKNNPKVYKVQNNLWLEPKVYDSIKCQYRPLTLLTSFSFISFLTSFSFYSLIAFMTFITTITFFSLIVFNITIFNLTFITSAIIILSAFIIIRTFFTLRITRGGFILFMKKIL